MPGRHLQGSIRVQLAGGDADQGIVHARVALPKRRVHLLGDPLRVRPLLRLCSAKRATGSGHAVEPRGTRPKRAPGQDTSRRRGRPRQRLQLGQQHLHR